MILTNQNIADAKRRQPVEDPMADPDGIITSPDEFKASAATVLLVKRIGDLLERQFPGWSWAISPDERGGVVTIRSLRLDARYGYLLHTAKIQNDPQLRAITRAAGEILERAGVPRGRYSYEAWKQAKRYMGLVAYDLSDKDAKMRRRYRDEAFTAAVKSGRVRVRVEDQKTATGIHRKLYIGEGNAR